MSGDEVDAEHADVVSADFLSGLPPSVVGGGQAQAIRTTNGDEDGASQVVLAGSLDENTECVPALLRSEFLGYVLDDAGGQKVTSRIADQDQESAAVTRFLGHEEIEEVGDAIWSVDRFFVPVLG